MIRTSRELAEKLLTSRCPNLSQGGKMFKTEALSADLQKKLTRLEEVLGALGSVAVGFSGGVDSTFLLSAAVRTLGDRVLAVTAVNPLIPERELREARAFCEANGIRQMFCKTEPLKIEACRRNAPDRCYHCKRQIFSEILRLAAANGFAYVAEGSNLDDLGDYRPGLRAIRELSVRSPLREAGLTKKEIRELSKALGLGTWNKPSCACLASRFAYGEEISEEKLERIGQAEEILIRLGFRAERVRLHGSLARIEVPAEDIPLLAAGPTRRAVHEAFRKLGFQFVTLDLGGFCSGSMNATLPGN